MNTVRIKICCIGSADEAALALRYGASALGFVSSMPSGPGVIPEELIASIVATVPPAVGTFLLTSRQDPAAVIEQQRRLRTNTLQLVDAFPEAGYAELRQALPGVKIVQVIHVRADASLDEARRCAPFVDGILLDSGNPDLAVKELGGTGRVHDWEVSRKIRDEAGRPVFLAGGLKPDNVAEAVRTVRPFGVDVCSGVRTGGVLDEAKLAAFVAAVRSAGVSREEMS